MDQPYSHHHLKHAHHTGIILGAVVGSCTVTLVAAVAFVAASPKVLFHPLGIASSVASSAEDTKTQSAALGVVGELSDQQAGRLLGGSSPSTGRAGQSLRHIISH